MEQKGFDLMPKLLAVSFAFTFGNISRAFWQSVDNKNVHIVLRVELRAYIPTYPTKKETHHETLINCLKNHKRWTNSVYILPVVTNYLCFMSYI